MHLSGDGMKTYWLVKHVREDKEEDGAQEVDSGDGNVETVSLLVHIRPHN